MIHGWELNLKIVKIRNLYENQLFTKFAKILNVWTIVKILNEGYLVRICDLAWETNFNKAKSENSYKNHFYKNWPKFLALRS
jgi:hypothetical protein